MRKGRAVTLVAAVTLALATAVGVRAGAFTLGPLVQVSGGSPLAGCSADNAAGQSGTVYLHSEVEPWVDVNPSNPNNIVGIWQQDRWSNGGSRGLVVGASTNGGASWTSVPTLKTTALHRRHGRKRRRLPAGHRPVGLVWAERDRLPVEPVVQ